MDSLIYANTLKYAKDSVVKGVAQAKPEELVPVEIYVEEDNEEASVVMAEKLETVEDLITYLDSSINIDKSPVWFKDPEDDGSLIWKRPMLSIQNKAAYFNRSEYEKYRKNAVMELIYDLPDSAKELSLFVTSTRVDEHRILAEKLYRLGYNVTVEMNGNVEKNYTVKYVNKSGDISEWNIPYSQIEAMADKGDLEAVCLDDVYLRRYGSYEGSFEDSDSGINQKEDISLSHMLQTALFMSTSVEKRIKDNVSVSNEEYSKLCVLSDAILHLDKSTRRPKDYPRSPRVALIAWNLEGRGIRIQNPMIDFTCTSFCFTQKGATNA